MGIFRLNLLFKFASIILFTNCRHEDGSIKFWDVSQVSMHLMCTINTSQLLTSELDDDPPHDPDADDEGWPPFKKVGAFDPLLDDNRFVILKLALCPVTQMLIAGGAGGQVMFYDLANEAKEKPEVSIAFSLSFS